jgi:hypothetical protein
MLALLVFTGFVVPIRYMLSWCRWINYLNPVAYGYEALMGNEYRARNFICSYYIPSYGTPGTTTVACDAVGAVPGQFYVNGDASINSAYSYYHSHKWHNVGVIIAMVIFNHIVYFVASEYITAKKSKGEILVFRRGFVPKLASVNTTLSPTLAYVSQIGLVPSTSRLSSHMYDSFILDSYRIKSSIRSHS